MSFNVIHEMTCAYCKRKFIPAAYHSYRVSEKGRMLCPYTCMLRAREAIAERKSKAASRTAKDSSNA